MVNHPDIEKADFSSVLAVSSGAAYLPPELADKLIKLVPKQAVFSEGGSLLSVRNID